MKWTSFGLFCVVAALGDSTALGQDRVARVPTGGTQAARATVSPGQAAIERAAAANKYAFLFFWKEQNRQTDAVWNELQPAIGRVADAAECVSVQTTNPAEKALVDHYGASRAPMPLILAIAPNGAITKALAGKFDERQFSAAFVSPCTQRCLKALQDRQARLSVRAGLAARGTHRGDPARRRRLQGRPAVRAGHGDRSLERPRPARVGFPAGAPDRSSRGNGGDGFPGPSGHDDRQVRGNGHQERAGGEACVRTIQSLRGREVRAERVRTEEQVAEDALCACEPLSGGRSSSARASS